MQASALTFEALQQETGWDADRLRELTDVVVVGRRQGVLAGPPGTGKTWDAGLVARYRHPQVASVHTAPRERASAERSPSVNEVSGDCT